MKLSICCLSFNHEKYIDSLFKSIMSQNIDFNYEILIADDASQDNTQKMISNYQKIFPKIIRPIFRKKNIGAINNLISVLKEAKGEYIAYCDGDDYWLDDNKIIKQIHALDHNSSCSYSFHDTSIVSEDEEFLGLLSKGRDNEFYETGVVTSKKVIGAPIRLVHANALLFRKSAIQDLSLLEKIKFSNIGDFPLSVILSSKGDCYYFKESMGAYRKVKTSISNNRKISDLILYKQLMTYYEIIDKHFNGVYKNELKVNKIGMKMSHLEEKLDISFGRKKYFQFLKTIIQMLLNHRKSQYTMRDILWIAKNKYKNKN